MDFGKATKPLLYLITIPWTVVSTRTWIPNLEVFSRHLCLTWIYRRFQSAVFTVSSQPALCFHLGKRQSFPVFFLCSLGTQRGDLGWKNGYIPLIVDFQSMAIHEPPTRAVLFWLYMSTLRQSSDIWTVSAESLANCLKTHFPPVCWDFAEQSAHTFSSHKPTAGPGFSGLLLSRTPSAWDLQVGLGKNSYLTVDSKQPAMKTSVFSTGKLH